MNDMNNKTNCGLYGIKTKITRDDLESLNIYIYIMNAMLFNIKNYACKVFVKIPPVTCLMILNVGTDLDFIWLKLKLYYEIIHLMHMNPYKICSILVRNEFFVVPTKWPFCWMFCFDLYCLFYELRKFWKWYVILMNVLKK